MMDGDALMALWPLLVNYTRRRLPDADVALCEDIAGDTVEKALTKFRDQSGQPDALRRWCVTVARNAVLDYQRSRWSTEAPLLLVDTLHGRTDAGNSRHAEWIDLRAGLEKIPEHHRERIRQFNDGYGHLELAAAAGLAHTTLKTTHRRAILALRTAMHAEATP